MAEKMTLKERWVRMSALMRSGIILSCLLVCVLAVGLVFRTPPPELSKVRSNGDGGLTIGAGDPGVTSELGAAKMTQLQAQLAQKDQQLEELRRRVDGNADKGNPDLERKIEVLAAQIDAINRAKPDLDKPLPVQATAQKTPELNERESPKMRWVGGVANTPKAPPVVEQAPIAYMPPGSFLRQS